MQQNMVQVISIPSSRSRTGRAGNIRGNSHGERERGIERLLLFKSSLFSSEKNLAVCVLHCVSLPSGSVH